MTFDQAYVCSCVSNVVVMFKIRYKEAIFLDDGGVGSTKYDDGVVFLFILRVSSGFWVSTRKLVLLPSLIEYGCACYVKNVRLMLFYLSFILKKKNTSNNSPLGAFLVTDVIPVGFLNLFLLISKGCERLNLNALKICHLVSSFHFHYRRMSS